MTLAKYLHTLIVDANHHWDVAEQNDDVHGIGIARGEKITCETLLENLSITCLATEVGFD